MAIFIQNWQVNSVRIANWQIRKVYVVLNVIAFNLMWLPRPSVCRV